jgi:hypothetical protein
MTLSASIERPPGPHSILPEKLLRKFMQDPIKTLMKIAYTYGDIAHFKFGRQHVYLLNDPEYIEDVLIRNYKNLVKSRALQVSKRLLGEGLVTLLLILLLELNSYLVGSYRLYYVVRICSSSRPYNLQYCFALLKIIGHLSYMLSRKFKLLLYSFQNHIVVIPFPDRHTSLCIYLSCQKEKPDFLMCFWQ